MCFQVFKDIRGLLLGVGAEVAPDQLGVLEEEGLALIRVNLSRKS